MRARRSASVIALASVLSLLHTVPAIGGAGTVRVETIPAIAGIEIAAGDRVFRTNPRGIATVALPESYGGRTEDLPKGLIRVPPVTRIDADTRLKFVKMYGDTATFNTYKRVTPTFTNLSSGEDVDPASITRISLKALTGTVMSISGRELDDPGYVWLNAARVAPISGELVNKPVPWSIQSVEIAGSNVVNRSQTRFVPGKGGGLEIPLLFFSTTFSANDALFGFSLGSGVQLHYPNGDVKTLELRRGWDRQPAPASAWRLRGLGQRPGILVHEAGLGFSRPGHRAEGLQLLRHLLPARRPAGDRNRASPGAQASSAGEAPRVAGRAPGDRGAAGHQDPDPGAGEKRAGSAGRGIGGQRCHPERGCHPRALPRPGPARPPRSPGARRRGAGSAAS